ncbi:MAG: FAD-dependent oxidoreductase [Pyrinomonadaceae bacterium]
MDIRTENPFWLMKNGYLETYFTLTEDIKTDFVIIGGGISGALLARSLILKGSSVVLVDRRHIAMGSTSASTALLQYDIDRTLHELIELLGERTAVRAYELSLKALQDLESVAPKLKIDNEFVQRPSIRFVKYKKDISFIEKEFDARKKHGFDVELWDEKTSAKHFPFPAPAALYTRPSATADPYRLTHGLLQDAVKRGARVFDKTSVKNIERLSNSVIVHTSQGPKIRAKKVVIACGYESVNYIPIKLATLSSSYAVVSEPMPTKNIWHENCTFWNTSDPYTYGRTTADNRIIFGGEDEPFYDPARRDKLLPEKTEKLRKLFVKMFPDLPFKVDYSWAGTFIETGDGLPYIGSIKELPHTYFALGYGGNGITFSQLAADILTDLLLGKTNKDAAIFSFDRKTD